MILSLECLGAHSANVLPFIAVRQLVLGQCRGVAKDFTAHLFCCCCLGGNPSKQKMEAIRNAYIWFSLEKKKYISVRYKIIYAIQT